MKIKSVFLLLLLWSAGLIVEACTPSGDHPVVAPTALTNPEIPGMQLSYPEDGSIHSLRNPIHFALSLGSINSSSVRDVTFWVNGNNVGAANRYFTMDWNAPHTGEFYVQGKAVLTDGATAITNPHRICVFSISSTSSIGNTGSNVNALGYLGPCEIPTQIPNPASTGNLSISAYAAPDVIEFSTDPICAANPNNITFVATVDDPRDLVAFASLDIGPQVYLNWVTTRPVNQKEYRTTVDLGDNGSYTSSGTYRWRIDVFGRDGQVLQTTDWYSIPIQQIECRQQPLEIATSTPSPSASNCPPGSYFAPVTNRCIQIQIITPKPRSPGSGGGGCPAGQTMTCSGISHQTCSCK